LEPSNGAPGHHHVADAALTGDFEIGAGLALADAARLFGHALDVVLGERRGERRLRVGVAGQQARQRRRLAGRGRVLASTQVKAVGVAPTVAWIT
jgi:hypothetical protein